MTPSFDWIVADCLQVGAGPGRRVIPVRLTPDNTNAPVFSITGQRQPTDAGEQHDETDT